MIHYLKGKVEFKKNKFVIIEVASIGYKVFCSPNTLKEISEGQEVKLFTYLNPKEGSCDLYGFLTREGLELFEALKEISGVGPRTALDLSIYGSLENLKSVMDKADFYKEVKGIGEKKIKKILLELTGKIKEISKPQNFFQEDEAVEALISLGFSRQKAKEVLKRIPSEIQETEEKIKEALKILGR